MPREGELILFDEADEHLYGHPLEFLALTRDNKCVCLTATSCEKKDGVENSVLNHMGIKVFTWEQQPVVPEFAKIEGLLDLESAIQYM